MTTDMSNIKCGCGFNATGPDQKANNAAFEAHECFDGDQQPTRWYHGLFSMWGAIVLFVIGYIAVEMVTVLR